MKTRRDFLAALGLGAGASVMGLPGTAHALGGRWLRGRGGCSACGSTSGCGCGTHVTPVSGMLICLCACPTSLASQSPLGYTYNCNCCNGGTTKAFSTYLYQPPYPKCTDSTVTDCIGIGCPLPSTGYPRRTIQQNVFEGFLIDPDAKDSNGKLHADAFANGIAAMDAKELKVYSYVSKSEVKAAHNVTYPDAGKNRFVVLYDLPPDMHIGIEVPRDPGKSSKAQDFSVPSGLKLPRFHLVTMNDTKYVVALIK